MCDPYSDRRHLLVEAYILYTNVYSPRVGLCWELISICYRARINGCVLLRKYATKWTYFEYNRCHNCFSHFPSIRFGYIVHMNIQTIFSAIAIPWTWIDHIRTVCGSAVNIHTLTHTQNDLSRQPTANICISLNMEKWLNWYRMDTNRSAKHI